LPPLSAALPQYTGSWKLLILFLTLNEVMPSQFFGSIFEQATIELLNDLISLFVIIVTKKTTAFAGFPV